MANLRGTSDILSGSFSDIDRSMGEVSDKPDNWEGESSITEQSFRTVHATIPPVPRKVSRKARFTERFDSVKLTKENLYALEVGYKRIAPKPPSPIDNQFRFEPSPGAKIFRISRKPLPESARDTIQKTRDEAVTQDHAPPGSKSDVGPSLPRSNTKFTDFLPCHQLRTWQQDDNEEWQRRRAQSLSAIGLKGIQRFNSTCDNLSAQSKKTANQLKGVIKRRVLDHDRQYNLLELRLVG